MRIAALRIYSILVTVILAILFYAIWPSLRFSGDPLNSLLHTLNFMQGVSDRLKETDELGTEDVLASICENLYDLRISANENGFFEYAKPLELESHIYSVMEEYSILSMKAGLDVEACRGGYEKHKDRQIYGEF